MRQSRHYALPLFLCVCLAAGMALATMPGETVNPNGFPSGEHFNLNILGKKADFSCPAQEYDLYGNPIYGNVIFVPEDGLDIRILMESGKAGGKGAKASTLPTAGLEVTDPCAGQDGDPAVLRLPPNVNGYRVYARALAKPTDVPELSITPSLVSAEDEFGNDLVFLGLVVDGGFQTPYGTFYRQKGRSVAVDITGMFNWTGTVCAFVDPMLEGTVTEDLCCTDANLDGVYESCVVPTVDLVTGLLTCPEGSQQVLAYCTSYENEWVFNIADFVTYLWGLDNSGVKNLQVRFYPN